MKTVWSRAVPMEGKERWLGLESISETTGPDVEQNMEQGEVKEGERATRVTPWFLAWTT